MPDQRTANKHFGKIIFPVDWQRGVTAVAQLPRPPGALPEWPGCGGRRCIFCLRALDKTRGQVGELHFMAH